MRPLLLNLLAGGLIAASGIAYSQDNPGWELPDDPDLSLRAGSAVLGENIPEDSGGTSSFMSLMSVDPNDAAAITPEIQSLASGLQGDAWRIFQYCHDRVRHETYWGSKKGANLTLLEGSGNSFDTSSLMVALLRAAGYQNVEYRYGFLYLDGPTIEDWLGLLSDLSNDGIPFPDLTDQQVRDKFGIPSTVTITTQRRYDLLKVDFLTKRGYPTVEVSGSVFKVPHVWVRFKDAQGVTRELDPTVKPLKTFVEQFLRPTGANFGYSRSTLLTTKVGGTLSSANKQIVGMHITDATGLNSQLSAYTTSFTAWLKANGPGNSPDDYINKGDPYPISGGTLASQSLAAGVDYANTGWLLPATWQNIPSQWQAKVTFTFGQGYDSVNKTFATTHGTVSMPISSLMGGKLSLSSSGTTEYFRLGEDVLSSFTVTNSSLQVRIAVDHPFGSYDSSGVFVPGTFGDQEEIKTYQRSDSASYAIAYGFDASIGSVRKSQDRLDKYRRDGVADADWRVRTETLNVMGLTYLSNSRSIDRICATRAKTLSIDHHVFGRVAQEDAYYIDIGLAASGAYSYAGKASDALLSFSVAGHFNSALEHGTIEQMQGSTVSALSTVKVIQLACAQGLAINIADNSNWTSLRTTLATGNGWPTAALDRIAAQITGTTNVANNAQVLVPRRGDIGLTASPATGQWRGYGYAVASNVQSGMYISGGLAPGVYSGGYASESGTVSCTTVVEQAQSEAGFYTIDWILNPDAHQPAAPQRTAEDPVDMASGSFLEQSTDLVCGQSVPKGLFFSRSYNSRRSQNKSPGLGNGWTHNLDIHATRRSAVRAALGDTTPSQMAATYVAVAVAMDVFATRANARDWAVTALTACWGIDQLRQNGVSVSMGESTLEFVKMPDGSFTPPPSRTMTLTEGTSGTLTLSERLGNVHTFDSTGRISQTQDTYGNTANFSYRTDGKLDWVTDCYGRKLALTWSGDKIQKVKETAGGLTREVQYAYDGDNLSGVTDPEGKTFTYVNVDGRIVATIDGRGRTIVENDYDDDGRVTRQRLHGDPAKESAFFFSGDRNVSRNPEGDETTYLYDTRGRCIGTIDANGNESSVAYDGQDHTVESASPKNNGADTNYRPAKFTYDSNQNLIRVEVPKRDASDALANTADRIYDSQNRLWKEYDFKGKYAEHLYNFHHQIETLKDRKGVTIQAFTYNPDGTLKTITDAASKVTTFSNYDSYGNSRTITYPSILVGGVTVVPSEQFVYDERGSCISHTDCNGNITTTTYNERRQPLVVTLPVVGGISATEEIQYDNAGNAWRKKDAKGNWTQIEIDQTGKALSVTLPATPAGTAVLTYHYDSRNWLSFSKDAVGRTTSYAYDPTGHAVSSTDPLSRTTAKYYDADGQVVRIDDARGKSTLFSYNQRGELYQTKDALNHITGTVPDANGRTLTATNRRTKSFAFTYDDNGKATSLKTPLFKTTTTAWNALGLVSSIDEPSGDRSEFTYDGMKRAKQTLFKRSGSTIATVDFDFDRNANPKKISETASGITRMVTFDTYDARNRLTSFTDVRGNTLGYQYDANGNLAILTYPADISYPAGRQVSYTYDAQNRLETVTDWASRVTRYSYDIAGRLLKIQRPNGTVRRFAWTDANEVKGISEMSATGSPLLWSVNQFDAGGRQISETGFPAPNAFTAPSFSATYDDDNRLTSFNGLSVVYDNDGNMTQGPLGPSSGVAYTYDSRNRLTAAGGLAYDYDPMGNRVSVTSSAGSTKWTIDSSGSLSRALVREKPDGTKTWYVYGLGLLYEVSDAGSTTTYHADSRGSTRAMSADDGATITARLDYDSFGRETWSSGVIDTPFRFNGAYGVQTDDNGICYMRARYYSPQIRRFLNADPSGFNGGSNWHVFANANPIAFSDPLGLNPGSYSHGTPRWVEDTFQELDHIWFDTTHGALPVNPEIAFEGVMANLSILAKGLLVSEEVVASTTTVFRVESAANARLVIDEAGNVSVVGEKMLFANFGDTARAESYLARRLEQGYEGTVVKSAEVPTAFVEELRATSVLESEASLFPNAPLQVDLKYADQFGLRAEQIQALQEAIIQGSGKVH